ncbi:hypothetical protein GCM10022243_48760 [Saccharothrix violaceirubra]|uniref:Uncharacterized protein n=1 Tax=Saccharothrix violaceirubra TaxID=413306 RepID=A0A7W7WUU0_9PSEU|nr:hypothetical protein [Saccharothrix violaceirubra]MBB4963783.1 hypothetical protein [Saccharothrix violaceirubra]
MRILRSDYETTVVEALKETVDALVETINRGSVKRSSDCTDKIGQTTFGVDLIQYVAGRVWVEEPPVTDPNTDTVLSRRGHAEQVVRWAVRTMDNNGTHYADTDDRTEADARYEYEVRQLADCAEQGTVWWHRTDVDGVPQCKFAYTIETHEIDGDWQRVESDRDMLGENEYGGQEDHEDAALRLAGRYVDEWDLDDTAAYDAVRVTVRRDGDDPILVVTVTTEGHDTVHAARPTGDDA